MTSLGCKLGKSLCCNTTGISNLVFKLTLFRSVEGFDSFRFLHTVSISDVNQHFHLIDWCVCCVTTRFQLPTKPICFTPVQTHTLLYVLSMILDALWCRSGSESDVNGSTFLVKNETWSDSPQTLKTMAGLSRLHNVR